MLLRLRAVAAAGALVWAGGVAGCSGGEGDETPAACLEGGDAYLEALAAAPEQVALGAGTPISDCLVPEQSGGDLAAVGEEMVAAATTLNAEAREHPGGPATVRLGFLVGAVERGAEGIHADLVRRLNAAARFSPSREIQPASFERSFGRGYAAGLESG